MHVDPIKPMLKAPRTNLLKLKYDALVSSFAFNSNLRRYTTERINKLDAQLNSGSDSDSADSDGTGVGHGQTLNPKP